MLLYKLSIAFAAALLGACVILLLQLTVGGGIQLVPMAAFIAPLVLGAALGFVVGLFYHKATGTVLRFLIGFIEW
jgi:hypothetical protein